MELLTYMFNLDTHKNGVQQILQGFETGDNISRRLVMALTEETEPVFLPQSGVTATMYTKRPAQSSPSLYSVEISGNNIIFDVPSDVLIEAGMVDMQLKLTFGANDNQMIMNAPRFQLEVWESLAQDSEAEDSQEYESLQQALARANAVYNGRITSFSFDEDFILTVQYGWDEEEETRVIYTTDIFAEAMENFANQLSEHYPTIQIGTVTEGNVTSVTNVGTEEHAIFNFVLQKGIQGEPGADGEDGEDGEDGYSPSASVTKVGKKATITITDETGTTTAEVSDGEDGSTVSWNQITQTGTKIAEVTINGTKYDVYAPNGGGSTVAWNQITQSGTKIATITINGVPTDIYAPTSGGGGATTLGGLDDVTITSATNGQILKYNATTEKWENGDASSVPAWSNVTNKPFETLDSDDFNVTNGELSVNHQDISGKMDKANPTGTGTFSLNRKADTTIGNYSFAEGYNPTASGDYSHAEGYNTTASADSSHSEGRNTRASGSYSHAEGFGTTASGSYSHAEGYNTTAAGSHSHASGKNTLASGDDQMVIGRFNEEDTTKAFIIGGGLLDSSRFNALTVDWGGNVIASGDFTGVVAGFPHRLSNKANAPKVASGTLSASSTSITLTLPSAPSSSDTLRFKTSVFGLNPTNCTVSGANVTLTFPAQSSSVTVSVEAWS